MNKNPSIAIGPMLLHVELVEHESSYEIVIRAVVVQTDPHADTPETEDEIVH